MDKGIVNEIKEQLTAAAKQGEEAVWSVYNTLIAEKGTDWQTLAAITVASSELFAKNANGKNNQLADTFKAMNEMVYDYASQHAEEMDDFRSFTENYCHWLSMIPT